LSRLREQVVVSRLHRSSMERVRARSYRSHARCMPPHRFSQEAEDPGDVPRASSCLLKDNGTLPVELAARMQEYVGLRNILVRRYMVCMRRPSLRECLGELIEERVLTRASRFLKSFINR